MRNPELWARLEAYSFDGAGSAPFSVKLARDQGWDAAFTARVIEEYRRFLYLTQVSKRQVTPSQSVDAAWHVHLTFTRDYWEDLCPNVIGASVHHQPCAGDEEMPRYRDQFAATKALYEVEFGAEPPIGIWGRDSVPDRPRLKALIRDEAGGSGETLVIVAAIGCILLYGTGLPIHWLVYVSIILAAYGLGTVINSTSRRRRRKRRDEGGEHVYSDEHGGSGESDGPRADDGRASNDKQSTGRGFWSKDDGGGDGGGCGGCGD